jgi:CHAD domain-containing protein
MAFRIEPGEPLPVALGRVVAEEIDAALAQIGRGGVEVHEGIHDARRAMRRARAAQALLRPGMDEAQWTAASAALREAGTLLSPLRDAQSVVEAVEAHLPDAGLVLDDAARTRLLRNLRRRRERIVAAGAPAIAGARVALARARSEVPLAFDGFRERDLVAGLAAGRRRLDRALAAVEASPDDEQALHRLRQRARVHWLQLELVVPAWPAVLGALAGEAKKLSRLLGDERDLRLLEAWLGRLRRPLPGGRPLPAVRGEVAELRAALRGRALRVARRLATEPPRRLARRISSLRDAAGVDAPDASRK